MGTSHFSGSCFSWWADRVSPRKREGNKKESAPAPRQAEPWLFTHYEPQQRRQVEVARLRQPVFHCSLCCRWPLCVSSARDKFHHWLKISLTFFLELFGSITSTLHPTPPPYLKHLITNLHLKFTLIFNQGHAPKLHLCLCTRFSRYKGGEKRIGGVHLSPLSGTTDDSIHDSSLLQRLS